MRQTRTQYWRARGQTLRVMTKTPLIDLYRRLGGLGGAHPVHQWRKDEIISSIIDMEWSRLPETVKMPDRPIFDPPCDGCGTGPESFYHSIDNTDGHHYHYTGGRVADEQYLCRRCEQTPAVHQGKLGNYCPDMTVPADQLAEEQPTRADATATTCPTCGGAPEIHTTTTGKCAPTAGSRWGDADRLPGRDEDHTEGPPCTRTGCGQAPAAHLGWALRHLWTMTDTRPVDAPPTDVEAAATRYADGPGCTPAVVFSPAPAGFPSEAALLRALHADNDDQEDNG